MSVVNVAKESLPDGFNAGHSAVGTVEQALGAAWPVRKHVIIRANAGNGDVITIGTKGNSANGFILAAGDTSPPIFIDDVSKVFVTGGSNGQNYSWLSI